MTETIVKSGAEYQHGSIRLDPRIPTWEQVEAIAEDYVGFDWTSVQHGVLNFIYRTPVNADLTDEEINKAVKQMIVTDNSELDGAEDPDMEIEEHDITVCGIDRDGIFNE